MIINIWENKKCSKPPTRQCIVTRHLLGPLPLVLLPGHTRDTSSKVGLYLQAPAGRPAPETLTFLSSVWWPMRSGGSKSTAGLKSWKSMDINRNQWSFQANIINAYISNTFLVPKSDAYSGFDTNVTPTSTSDAATHTEWLLPAVFAQRNQRITYRGTVASLYKVVPHS